MPDSGGCGSCLAGLSRACASRLPCARSPAKTEAAQEGKSKARRNSSLKPKGFINGFPALPEPVALSIEDSGSIATYSMPQEVLTFTPQPRDVVQPFGNGDSERMIFCNTELTKTELMWLDNCRAAAIANKEAFIPSVTVAAGRFLGDVGGNVNIALERMRDAQDWRLDYLQDGPITDTQVKDDLLKGIMYFAGRDASLRPLLVVRPSQIPVALARDPNCADRFNRAFMFLMEYFLRYMVVPGRVENICVLLDLKDVSVKQVPLSALMEIKKVLSQQNAGRVYRFYICNMPVVLAAIATVVKAAMTERQRQKIRFIHDCKEMRQYFALHQLEQSLGGSRPSADRKFPFPLLPGPFDAGYAGGPRDNAVPNLHKLLTTEGARGRVWNPEKSKEDNTKLELALGGGAMLRRVMDLQRAESEQQPLVSRKDSGSSPKSPDVIIESEADCWRSGWSCAACVPNDRRKL
mmetsp:Transcript_26684/g.48922  ORF Transcript_26684/g.48922 Transcript_26684/m.48922 type:complete len:464 (-) Transcript_26684:82-1473(-)